MNRSRYSGILIEKQNIKILYETYECMTATACRTPITTCVPFHKNNRKRQSRTTGPVLGRRQLEAPAMRSLRFLPIASCILHRNLKDEALVAPH